jgi:uncharacterized protein YwqG
LEEEEEDEVASPFEELEAWLIGHRRWAWKPVVKKGDGLGRTSKFSGTPWLRTGESWPACGNCHGPMHFFLQINLNELPKAKELAFGKGMLQFFHCLKEDCLYGRYCQDPYSPCLLLRIVEVERKGSAPAIPDYEGAPAFPAKSIVGWKKVADFPSEPELPELGLTYEDGKIECKEIGFDAEDAEYEDFHELARCVRGDKLAGWPDWVQAHTSYPNCRVCKKRMDTVLFNLGCDDNIPFMFADGGHGPILQCPVHKDVLAFTWDSG